MCLPVLVRREEPPVLPHRAADETERPLRRSEPLAAAEHRRRARHPGDHERVPADQHLVVAPRAHALLPRGEELFSSRIEQAGALVLALSEGLGDGGEGARDIQVPVHILEVGRAVQSVMRREHRVFVRRNERLHFPGRPHVELALLVL